jgi:hypothetical protein
MFADWCDAVAWFFKRSGRPALVAALYTFALSQLARAQDALPPASALKNPSAGANLTNFFSSKTPYEFWLSCLICAFGLAVIYALMFGLRRSVDTRPEDIARPIIVVTVITGTLMLITVGYNNEQIAPAFGLFGTIVGYMLGRFAQPQPSPGPEPDPKQSAAGDQAIQKP